MFCTTDSSTSVGARHSWAILSLLFKRLRQVWPKVKIIFRGDGGFCRWKMLRWCDRHGIGDIVHTGRSHRQCRKHGLVDGPDCRLRLHQVVIKKVTVGRKVKGDDTYLIIGARLFTKKRLRRMDLLIEAMVDGEVAASELLKKVRFGLSIPGHDKTGMVVTGLLKMPQQQFDRLFSDDVERKLRLTLTIASG